MEEKLIFKIVDKGVRWIPQRERFLAIAPNVNRCFRTRPEAEAWLNQCYRFISSLYGFPLLPAPDFHKADFCEVQL